MAFGPVSSSVRAAAFMAESEIVCTELGSFDIVAEVDRFTPSNLCDANSSA